MHAPQWQVDCVWSIANIGETSGLFACFVGLMLGYDEIVLAGVPADNQPHYFDPQATVIAAYVQPREKSLASLTKRRICAIRRKSHVPSASEVEQRRNASFLVEPVDSGPVL